MREKNISNGLEVTQVMADANPVRILVIDNDICYGKSLVELLHVNGFFAYFVDNIEEAKSALPWDSFEIIICNAKIPGLRRDEMVTLGRKHHPLMEVIFISSSPTFNEALQAIRDGGFDYIGKERLFSVVAEKIRKTHRYQLNHLLKNFSSVEHSEICEQVNNAIPAYKITRIIGRGATGIVMLAECDNQSYAIKLLCREALNSQRGKLSVSRFLAEAKVVANIDHPNIIKIYESGFLPQSNVPYMLMEYIDGGSLLDYIAADSFHYQQKICLITQLCDALKTVHQYGILHCDIKPANIMIQHSLSAKLMDFGIARTIESVPGTAPEIAGSPAYMSPEAFLGIHHIDQRSDIFSLGIVACELLTGQRPFSGASITSIVKSQKIQRSRITMEKFTKLPLDIRNIISKMLKNNPDERYQNAADIITDLANISVS